MSELLFEILLELILQVLVEGVFEVSSQELSKRQWFPTAVNAFFAALIYFSLGAVAGVFVTIAFPYRFIRTSRFHGLTIVVIPLGAALTMVGLGALRRWKGKPLVRLDRFAYAYLFAFGMALSRFAIVQ